MKKETHISVKNISKTFKDGTKALHDIELDIGEGEIVVLLGPSGCGKSTLLRIIAGLEQKTDGEIYFHNEAITGVPVEERNVGMVFQNYALFPTMTVRENIEFGLKLRKYDADKINNIVNNMAELMDLKELLDKKPRYLSGGQQQRVALSRVLAIRPRVLLMDEPLTALDAKLKKHLEVELSKMLRQLGITTVYVTHDQEEAMSIADRIAIMNGGVIEQIDTPENIYLLPKTAFTAEFIGKINKLQGKYLSRENSVDLGYVKLPYTGAKSLNDGDDVTIFVRPEDISVLTENESSEVEIKGKIEQLMFMGGYYHIEVNIDKQNMLFEIPNTTKLKEQGDIRITLNLDNIKML